MFKNRFTTQLIETLCVQQNYIKFELRGEVETNLKHPPPLGATNAKVLARVQILRTNGTQSWGAGCTVSSSTFIAGNKEAVPIGTQGTPLVRR